MKRILPVIFTICGVCFGSLSKLDNEYLKVEVAQDNSKLICQREAKTFAEMQLPKGTKITESPVAWEIQGIGTAEMLELTSETGRMRIGLVSQVPFVFVQAFIVNHSSEAKRIETFDLLEMSVLPELPSANLRVLGSGGLERVGQKALTRRLNKNPVREPATSQDPGGSYMFLAAAEPETRNGVVSAWISSDRGSGIVLYYEEGNRTKVRARIDYGRLMVSSGSEAASEIFVIGCFDDARLGLESYADLVAKYYAIKLPPQCDGYCTWYSRPNGGACDEVNILKLAESAKEKLVPYGFDFIQIDDKWQEGVYEKGPRMVFSKHRQNGPYPNGMKAPAEKIKKLGIMPGIWWIPFGGKDFDPFFADKQELFVKNEDGSPRAVKWGGTVLDLTNPAAMDYVASNAKLLSREWGYDYFKLDGLWVGTGTENQYGNNEYEGDDKLGCGIVHNPNTTPIEAYRLGLKTVREAAGQDTFLLGCNISQNMRSFGASFGLLDAMRIGPDNKKTWGSLVVGPWSGSNRYFLHKRVWYNDPDPVYVAGETPLHHAQLICSWVSVTGSFNVFSEWLPGLDPERVRLLQRTLPSHELFARPADLFERNFPRIWVLKDPNSDKVIVGLFNLDWEWNVRSDIQIKYPMDKLGLDARTTYDTYEFWTEQSNRVQGSLEVNVPLESCRVLSMRPTKEHPQVISTSRHITQGIVDLKDELWNAASKRLTGTSDMVNGDPYELRIVVPSTEWKAASVQAPDCTIHSTVAIGRTLRIGWIPQKSGKVQWQIEFNQGQSNSTDAGD